LVNILKTQNKKYLKSLFQEIEELDNWNYYNRDYDLKKINWNDNANHQEFIKNFLRISGKELIEDYFFTTELKKAGISLDNFERATHTNSVFFIGILLYQKLQLKDKISFIREDGEVDEFLFIWFITSMVHDFGYFAEHNKEKFSSITEDISSLKLTHDLLSYDKDSGYLKEAYKQYRNSTQSIIDAIPNYFKDAFNGKKSSSEKKKIEHGIYAGLLLYDGLVKNRKQKKEQRHNNLYWEDDLDKFYAIASFAISIHSMRREGIVENSEDLKFSIESEPFLFLFALADTIEPTKVFHSKDPEYILKNILIDIQKDKIILKNDPFFRLDFSKLVEKVCGLESWLNVKVCNEGRMLTIYIK